MSRQHKSRCLHLLKLYVIQCYAPLTTLTSSARLRYIIRHVSTISRSQMHYLHKVCHEYTSIHSDIFIILFVCLHITYCKFLYCNKADHFSHVQHLCIMHVQMKHMSLHAHFPLPVNISTSDHTMSEKPPAKRGRGRSAIRNQSRSQEHTASNIFMIALAPYESVCHDCIHLADQSAGASIIQISLAWLTLVVPTFDSAMALYNVYYLNPIYTLHLYF